MSELLSSEQVDEIRRRWAPGPDHALTPAYVMEDVLALCDTVESLRVERDWLQAELTAVRADAAAQDATQAEDYTRLLRDFHRVEQLSVDMATAIGADTPGENWTERARAFKAELETLRGIAKRLADGWLPHEAGECWGRRSDRYTESMTEAEVHAIYGPEDAG